MKSLFLILVLAFPINCVAQPWMKTYGPFSTDGILGEIVETYDHGFVLGGHYLTSQSMTFGWVVKIDVNGEILWEKNIGSDQYHTKLIDIDKTIDKGLIIAGETSQFDPTGDAFFLKLDSCGNKAWCTILKTNGNWDFANEIHQLTDMTYIALVSFYTDDLYKRTWLFHLDVEGNTLWSNFYKQDTNYISEQAFKLLITSDSCFLITATNYTEVVPGSGLYWHSPFWIKVDNEGNELWEATWHQEDYLHGDLWETVETNHGYYIGVGNNGFNPPSNYCIYKLYYDGMPFQRLDLFPESFAGNITAVDYLQDSTLVLGGSLCPTQEGCQSQVLIADTNGYVNKQFDLPLDDGLTPMKVFVTSDNKIFYLIARDYNYPWHHFQTCLFKFNSNLEYDSIYTVPYSYDTLCSNQIISETIPLDCWPVGVNDDITGELNNSLTIAPNPASGIVTFKIPETFSTTSTKNGFTITKVRPIIFINLRITIYDNTGSKIFEIPISKGDEKINTDVTDWREGLYMVVLQNDSQIFSSEKLIVTH